MKDTLTHEGIYSNTALPMQLPYLLSDKDILKNNHIAYINPFRYRSYYYDTETNLYYLTSRYYDPETGRFINADDISYADPETINGLNLFAYCANNAIMNFDPTGHVFITALITMLIGGLIGAAFGGISNAIGQAVSGNQWNWESFGLSIAGGFAAGFVASIPIGGLIGTFVFGGFGSIAGGMITGSIKSWETAILAFGIGAITNVVAYGINNKYISVKANKIFIQNNKTKSLIIQQLQSHPLNMGAKALKGSFRNAFKTIPQKEIQKLLINSNFWLRNGLYSSIISSVLSGWY